MQIILCLLQLGLLLFGAIELLCHPVSKLLRLLQLLGGWQRAALLGPKLLELALDVVNFGLIIAFIGVKAVAQDILKVLEASEELASLLNLFVDGISTAGCVVVARACCIRGGRVRGICLGTGSFGCLLRLCLEALVFLLKPGVFFVFRSCFALEAQLPFSNSRL